MKKIFYSAIVLLVAGALISFILFMEHYSLSSPLVNALCGDGLYNSCTAVSISEYSAVFGIPIAAFGLLFYLWIFFVIVGAQAGEEKNFHTATYLLLPVMVFGLLFDCLLVVLLFIIGDFCNLCGVTYLINILLFLLFYLDARQAGKDLSWKCISSIYRELQSVISRKSQQPAVSWFIYFTFFLTLSIYGLTFYMNKVHAVERPDAASIQQYLEEYKKIPREEFQLPESNMSLGDKESPLNIIVFTDPLCSMCYKFHNIEKYLFARFKNKIRFTYYLFPLDKSCNKGMRNTVYENSCIAAATFVAAEKNNMFETVAMAHFDNYKKLKALYAASTGMDEVLAVFGSKIAQHGGFKDEIGSEGTKALIQEHIAAANKINVNATPTIFINGKRILGAIDKEFFAAAIKYELKELQKKK